MLQAGAADPCQGPGGHPLAVRQVLGRGGAGVLLRQVVKVNDVSENLNVKVF